jgi:hypothetical protein
MNDDHRDANDILRERGPDALREAFDKAKKWRPPPDDHIPGDEPPLPALPPQQMRDIPLIRFDQIKLGTQRRHLVKNLIPRIGLTVVWGPPKCGKSFWAFDVVMHVALDRFYRKRRVHPGTVVYCAFEGASGIDARKTAWEKTFLGKTDPAEVPFYLQPITLDLVRDHRDLIANIKAKRASDDPPLAAIVLDTLNRSIGGSESSDEDMTAYVNAAEALVAAFNCAVIVVHHCGVEGTRPRGHTSLTGAAEAQLKVSRNVAGYVIVEVEYMKDGAEGATVVSRLKVIPVGKDEDKEDITSCIVEAVEDTFQPEKKRPTLSDNDELARRALADLAADQGKAPPATWGLPNGVQVVPVEIWHTTLTSRDIVQGDRRRFWDLKNRLKRKSIVAERDQFVWLA